MITHAELIRCATQFVDDTDDMYKKIAKYAPSREPLARVVLNEAIRAFGLIMDDGPDARLACVAVLTRANLLAEALRSPLQ